MSVIGTLAWSMLKKLWSGLRGSAFQVEQDFVCVLVLWYNHGGLF